MKTKHSHNLAANHREIHPNCCYCYLYCCYRPVNLTEILGIDPSRLPIRLIGGHNDSVAVAGVVAIAIAIGLKSAAAGLDGLIDGDDVEEVVAAVDVVPG